MGKFHFPWKLLTKTKVLKKSIVSFCCINCSCTQEIFMFRCWSGSISRRSRQSGKKPPEFLRVHPWSLIFSKVTARIIPPDQARPRNFYRREGNAPIKLEAILNTTCAKVGSTLLCIFASLHRYVQNGIEKTRNQLSTVRGEGAPCQWMHGWRR